MHAVGPAAMARHITVGIEEGSKVRRLAQRLSSTGAAPGGIEGPLVNYVLETCRQDLPFRTCMCVCGGMESGKDDCALLKPTNIVHAKANSCKPTGGSTMTYRQRVTSVQRNTPATTKTQVARPG